MHWLASLSALRARRCGVLLLLASAIVLQPAPARADTAAAVDLPHTDGYGLLAKPPAFTEAESARIFMEGKLACDGPCVTPFATVLGVADGAEGRSNCVSACIRPEYSFLDLQTGAVSVHQEDPKQDHLHYIGVTYQCVEYVRKWWMKNKGITFGSIDSAHEILYLTEGADIRSKAAFPLARSINGTATRPPKRGDLLIYYPERSDPEWRHGHAAVVVAVDLEQGIVSLAEENYDNAPWQDPDAYARRIRLFNVAGRYTLLDVAPDAAGNPEGGRISGWIYPLAER
ncbi:MAG: CHAP domain-containing protein [Pseudomonadota bacterium]|nr:CHAP domain-containing protein [Pseudomonadota bacterium]